MLCGKCLLSPDPRQGLPWTFHHVKIDLPQTTYTISCSIIEGAGSTLGPHAGAPANSMTKKNPRLLNNLLACNLFLSELKPGLVPSKKSETAERQLP